MQTLKDILDLGTGHSAGDIWNGCVACVEVDDRQLGDGRQISFSHFAFLLLTGGTLEAMTGGRRFTLHAGDMLIYAPALSYQSLAMSPDYRGYFLAITEQAATLSPTLQHLPAVAYFPTTSLGSPQLTIPPVKQVDIVSLFRRLRHYITHESPLQRENIIATLGLLVSDLVEVQNTALDHIRVTSRDEQIFNAFLSLVASDYLQHRDLRHYADRLNITTTYLSRVVRRVSGHTVLEFIHHRLADEAALRLKTTTRTVSQLADDLHFPDAATFSKFFHRMKGCSPKEYRGQAGWAGSLKGE